MISENDSKENVSEKTTHATRAHVTFSSLSGLASLATRGSVAKTPYFLETISCPAPITGEFGKSGRNSSSDGLAEKPTIPNESRESLGRNPRVGIMAENRRFHNLFASLITALSHRGSAKVIGISCRDALSVWAGFWACFFETRALSACPAFFDLCAFPLGSAWKVRF